MNWVDPEFQVLLRHIRELELRIIELEVNS